MPCFTDLSSELYLEILQYLPPPDLGSFYCVNKHLYGLTAIHRIRYQSLKRRFSTSLSTKPPGSTAKLIKSIFADPQIALYVQHYTINGSRRRWGFDDEDSGPEHVEYKSADMAQLELAMRDSDIVSVVDVDIEIWIALLKQGDEYVLIAIALMLFPNLTSIDITTSLELNWSLEMAIQRIADAKRSEGPLAKLTSVTMIPPDSKSFVNLQPIEVFSKLPSVKIINVGRTYDASDGLELIEPTVGSNVTDLNVMYGDVSPQRLMLLLQKFESLQSFTYWPTNDFDPDHSFDAFSIITSLLACARDSLRELHIRAGSADKEYMGSLRKFRVLEYLETDTVLLFGESDLLAQSFQSSLPISMQEVKLHGSHPNSEGFRVHLTSLTETLESFPKLSKIELYETGMSRDEVATLQDLFAVVDISLTVVDTFKDRGPEWLPTFTRHRGHYAERQARKALTQPEVL